MKKNGLGEWIEITITIGVLVAILIVLTSCKTNSAVTTTQTNREMNPTIFLF